MAKKRNKITEEEVQRQTRKDILIARKQARQTRQIRLAMMGVGGLLLLVILVAIVMELFVNPNRAVALVNGEEITLKEWQERVEYERGQRIRVLENQLEAFGGDVGIIQQFASQMIIDLIPENAETFGQDVLDQMVNETAARQLAEARGITVTEADIDEAIGESFNYFGGNSPTPLPSPTETVMPTPSITPLPTAVITEVLPTLTPFPTPTTGPTRTPLPTSTPVSEASFQEQLADDLAQLKELGVSEATFRAVIKSQIYQERLMDVLATERELPTEAQQASIFIILFDTEEDAAEGMNIIQESDFLTAWNSFRSGTAEVEFSANATELLWRTKDEMAGSLGQEAADLAFSLPIGQPSEVISRTVDAETTLYFTLQVSGREVRPLSDAAFDQDKADLLQSTINDGLQLESTDFWRGRVPDTPRLDPKFRAAPTATPPVVLPTPTSEGTTTEPTPGS